MTTGRDDSDIARHDLRLWPGVGLALILVLVRYAWPALLPAPTLVLMLGGLALTVAILLWWAFFSRAPWLERGAALLLVVLGLVAVRPLLHESVATAGQGVLFFIQAVPIVGLALVAWAVATRRLASGPRRVALVVTILLACGGWALVRTTGITGEADSDFAWRWSPTAEERLLARSGEIPSRLSTSALSEDADVAWPGFRGPARDSRVPGARIATDWDASPPTELWRRPIGPGWSSFAVQGDLLFTQEQRGDHEAVSAYRLSTGEPVWQHLDEARFWESNGGAGPRATPTLAGGRVYALGATGILNVLEAGDGSVVWSRDARADSKTEVPGWGYAGSPLVLEERVVVAASSRLAAYDRTTGDLLWLGPEGGEGYSSPWITEIGGVEQLLFMSNSGAIGLSPEGTILWQHDWSGAPIVQPAVLPDGDLLISTTGASGATGMRRLSFSKHSGGWTVQERWTSIGLKPNFNDFVVHEGHVYGFDGSILACIELEAGERRWKGGRYGHGQMLLLPEQDLLLVLSERGELALVGATPERFEELARIQVLEGKTWNHPVLVDGLLLVRNGREMAAYRLAPDTT